MGGGAGGVAVHIGVADIIKWGQVDVANARHVIADIPGEVRHQGYAPFDAAHPGNAALALTQVVTAKLIAAAEGEELTAQRDGRGAAGAKGPA